MCQSLYSVVLVLVLGVSSGCCGVVFQDINLYEGSPCELSDGRPGICTHTCAALITPVNQWKICGFKGSQVLTCCASKGSYPILDKVCSDRTQSVRGRSVQRSFITHRFEMISDQIQIGPIEDTYDEVVVQRIHPVALNEHPHMAALGIRRGENSIEWFCGGTLIHESFVLTAAHCISNIGTPNVVRIGETDLGSLIQIFGPPATQFTVESTHMHEDYQPPLFYNDIALLKIEKQLNLGYANRLLPSCIWTAGEPPTNKLLMMGYGAPAFSQEHTNKLYQGNLTTVKTEECTLSYDGFTDLPKGITDSQICAHDPNGVLDTCEGDSGGPLQFNADDQTRTPYLVGITSFGVLCLDGNPGVYTKVGAYLDWIEGTIRNLTSI